MVEPASKQLQQVLLGLKLCTAKDLRRSRSRVKRLSGDLPAFDSVWIDALVQSQRLTSYQAQAIETAQTDDLRIGPSIVLARLGGCVSETFLARDVASALVIVVKRAAVPVELKAETLARLKGLTDKARGIQHPGVVVPHACNEVGPSKTTRWKPHGQNGSHWPGARVDLAVASRIVEGLSLSDLLLRRGRFPAFIVLEIARQLLDSLSFLHQHGIVHGQLELSNIRLQASGQTILLDAGITSALQPELQINAFIRPDRYDNIAPELIGTGRTPTPQTDLYALGILLWQLLAGRPPFPTGDPLAKLASHQTQRVEDVRELAPDTPMVLAQCIQWLTEPQPKSRPKSAREVLVAVNFDPKRKDPPVVSRNRMPIGIPRRSGRITLKRFTRSFQQPASRRLPKPSYRFSKFVAAATVIVILAATLVVGLHGRSRNWILAEMPRLGLPISLTETTPVPDTPHEKDPIAQSQLLPTPEIESLPKPDAKGVIDLDTAGPYLADKILWQGRRLTLRGTADQPARILVKETPLWLRADEVILDHVHIEFAAIPSAGSDAESQPTADNTTRLLEVWSQELTLQNCWLTSPTSEQESASASNTPHPFKTAITWIPRDPNDSLPRKLSLQRTRLIGDFSTVTLFGRSHQIRADNVLKAGGGPLFAFETQPSQKLAQNEISLTHCTLRECGSVVVAGLHAGRLQASLDVKLNATALALRSRPDGRGTEPFCLVIGDQLLPSWDDQVAIMGVDSVTLPGLTPFAVASRESSRYQQLPDSTRRLRGLMSVDFVFRGASFEAEADSLINEFLARLRNSVHPGIYDPDSATR